VAFAQTEEGQLQVALEHARLSSQADLDDMRLGWSWALDSLKAHLETGKPLPFNEWQAGHHPIDPATP